MLVNSEDAVSDVVYVDNANIDDVTSVTQLNDLLIERVRRIGKGEDDHVIRYFRSFMKDLRLQRLFKDYFDERIGNCLREHFYCR